MHIYDKYKIIYSYDYSEYINKTKHQRNTQIFKQLNIKNSISLTIKEFIKIKNIPDNCSVMFKDIKFDIFFNYNSNNKLYVILSGFKTGEQIPLFKRWSWNMAFDGSVLYISDPMFYLFPKIKLGWYYGTQDINIYSYMYKLIYIIKRKYNFNNLIFYGSSGGGYAALQCATYFKNSLAIAINPQIYINKFGYSKEFYKITNIDLDKKDKYERNLLVDRILKSNSKFFIIQNETDKDHCSNHLFPFMKKINIALKYGLQAKNNIYIWIYHAFGGHNAQENKEILQFIIYISNFIIENKKITSYEETLCIAFSELWAQFFWLKYCCTDRH